jgi:hypothetical protein
MVAHTCNPSCVRDRSRKTEIQDYRQKRDTISEKHIKSKRKGAERGGHPDNVYTCK